MLTYDTREDLLQPIGCTDRFDLPAIQAILKLEQRLADWVREGHSGRIYKGDIAYSPSLRKESFSKPWNASGQVLTISTRAT